MSARRAWSLLLLGGLATLACSDDAPGTEASASASTDTGASTDSGTSTDTDTDTGAPADLPAEAPRPILESPAEAEDLDPDPDVVHVELRAAPYSYEVDGELVEGWAYNGQIPGPTIRAKRGDTLIVDFTNALDAETTIHWHGLHVPWAMDGVTWMSAPVAADGGTFTYSFEIDQAGTYWYHPHVDTDRQLDLGLYGVIVVEDPDDPPADRELVVVFDSWGEFESDTNEGSGHLGLDGADLRWTSNGLIDPVFPAEAGERIRVRAVNVANAGYVDLTWPQMRHIASDQGLLADLREPASVVLAPSDRMDGEWDIGDGFDVTAQPYSLLGAPAVGEPARLLEVVVDAPGSAPAPLDYPFSLDPPTPDPGWTDIVYAFHGDPHTGRWTINGERFPDITVESLAIDTWAIVELRNISQTAHPFHLHGHRFEVLAVDGVAPELRRLEDTLDVAPYSIVRLGLLADNPGDWMAHCHILPHVEGGMMTVLRVE